MTPALKTILALCLLVPGTCIFHVPQASAQCATGVNTGGGCIPPDAPGMPGYQGNIPQQQPAQPRTIWADRWGAIVIAEDTGGAGTVSGRASKSEAIDASMRDCASHGAKKCKLELAYHNQCAAVAWGTGYYGVAGSPTELLAKSNAIKFCERGASDCKIVYSGCSLPVRIQ